MGCFEKSFWRYVCSCYMASSCTFTWFYRVNSATLHESSVTRTLGSREDPVGTRIHTFFWATQMTLLVILLNLRMCEMEHPVSVASGGHAENLSYIQNSRKWENWADHFTKRWFIWCSNIDSYEVVKSCMYKGRSFLCLQDVLRESYGDLGSL